MDLSLTDEHAAIRTSVKHVCDSALDPHKVQMTEAAHLARLRQIGEVGKNRVQLIFRRRDEYHALAPATGKQV